MSVATNICVLSSGVFLLIGMLSGVWKYRAMLTRDDHRAPIYVDMAHRAALMYSFAAVVLMVLVQYSPYSSAVVIAAVAVPNALFAIAIGTYLVLGWKGVSVTQFSERRFHTTTGMYLLIIGEVGGVAVLLAGFVQSQML